MSNGPIALLSTNDLKFVPEPPIFQTLTAETLGIHATDADGFDASLSDTASLLSDGQSVVDAMGADLAESGAALAEPETDSGAQLAADLTSAGNAADATLNDYMSNEGGTPQTVAPTPPDPSTPPTPPSCHPDESSLDVQIAILNGCGVQPNRSDLRYQIDNGDGTSTLDERQYEEDFQAWQDCKAGVEEGLCSTS